jgi:ABC-type polysaccharide/polyol phosphate transport system ATPase subunit
VLHIRSLSKRYTLRQQPWQVLLGDSGTDFWALRNVSLEVARGEFVAIVGPNGSGKSTLLQIVCGILQPTTGHVTAQGRIAALLELGAGFSPELTGRENVLLNSEVMGMARGEMAERLPRIAEFAGIGEFLDRPVKEYSSGMYVRLAFSAAIHVDPEILIVDEALAVGDALFANRCVQKFDQLRDQGVTVLFVSHDLGLVKRLATRAVLMLGGRVEADGHPSEVVNRYIGLVHEWQSRGTADDNGGPGASLRHGDGSSRIRSARILDKSGNPVETVASGDRVTVRVAAEFVRAAEDPIVGILIRNRLGIDVFGTNTRVEGRRLGAFAPGDTLEVDFEFECLLSEQDYTLTAATQNWDGSSQDWLDGVLSFAVTDERAVAGLASFPVTVSVKRGERTNA